MLGIWTLGIDGALVVVGCSCFVDSYWVVFWFWVVVSGVWVSVSVAGISICGSVGGGVDSWLFAQPARRMASSPRDSNFCILIN